MPLAVVIPASGPLQQGVDRARLAEKLGYASAWVQQVPRDRDASLVLAAYAAATTRVGLGTSVLPIYSRHPTSMAQMAATLFEMSAGRFRLGLGVSHRFVVEGMLGLSMNEPIAAMREYLTIVRAALRQGAADFSGRHFTAHSANLGTPRPELRVFIAALNPRMLELAGELADGVHLWMCPPEYLEAHAMPRLRAGRARAGLPWQGFEVMAAAQVCLTSDIAGAREALRKYIGRYAGMEFYRRMMDAGGFGPQLGGGEITDAMVERFGAVGAAPILRDLISRYRAAGSTCTMVSTVPFNGLDGWAGFEATITAVAGV